MLNDGRFHTITGVVAIHWDGVPIPLEPQQVKAVSLMLSEGYVYADQISSTLNSAVVQISKIREIFRDIGIPYKIECPQYRKRKSRVSGIHERTMYHLVPIV